MILNPTRFIIKIISSQVHIFHKMYLVVFATAALLVVEVSSYTPQSPIQTFSEDEKIIIDKLRDTVKDELYKDYMKGDTYLIRWLQDTNFDVKEAAEKLRRALEWRKGNKMDGILDESIYDFQQSPYEIEGIDIEGNLVVICIPGRVDMRGAILTGKKNDAIRYFDQFLEVGEYLISGVAGYLNHTIKPFQLTVILDGSTYTLRQHACLNCIQVYLEWIRHYEKYYPGYLKHLIFINAPRYMLPLIELMKPLLSKDVRNSLQVYGPNKNEWIPVLKKLIPDDFLRSDYGGSKTEIV